MQASRNLAKTLRSVTLRQGAEDLLEQARRGLSSAGSLKEVLKEKIPAEQVGLRWHWVGDPSRAPMHEEACRVDAWHCCALAAGWHAGRQRA